ncbi:amidohydrolase [Roseovarius sp. SCSIO 43702]|uniref:amidohydrolase n=1 Tax=Roseovarius sp. SCSIO 43702 TaxID=2823043 RepID=UPI0021760B70|nr:amidohydrolase [Roseovarius sp. SCSIO 43702]
MEKVDRIIVNGRLLTFEDGCPQAEALAIGGGRIVAVGSTSEMRALAGPDTRITDAQGGTVLPGFIDSHVHIFGGSVELETLSLKGVTGRDNVARVVREEAAARPEAPLVFAVQADYGIFGERHGTTRHDLDAILPDRPLAMYSPDYHTVWASTAALELAGLLRGGDTVAGSRIVMGEDGLATGELQEPGAFGPLLRYTRHGGREKAGIATGRDPEPAPTAAERAADREAIRRGLAHCAAHGITGLHNMDGNPYQMELLAELEAEGALPCRIEVPFHFKAFDELDRFEEAEEMRRRWRSDRLWCNRVKMFVDGVIESHTALMLRPYPGTDHCGDAVFAPEHFNAACIEADRRGFQIAVHAIGDLAVRRTLDGYAAARATNGARDARHRVEHIEVLHPDDLPRFAELGVVASYQPVHAAAGHVYPPEAVGVHLHDDQKRLAYAWQDMRASGARVCFSTDWPVVGVNPMTNLRAAVAPRRLPPPWGQQAQGLHDALASMTRDNAWVEFAEDRKGRLAPGYVADIVVMRDDLEAMDPDGFEETGAAITLSGGEVTFAA